MLKKNELVIFKHKKKKLECQIRIISLIAGKDSILLIQQNLGVEIDENLNWKDHIHYIATKLKRANALLFKIRNYVNFKNLETNLICNL